MSLLGLGLGETAEGISLELLDNLVERQGVSGTAHGLVALARDMVVDGVVLLSHGCKSKASGSPACLLLYIYLRLGDGLECIHELKKDP